MRSHSLLFLVLAIILACSNVVLADSPAEGRALNAVEPAVMRSLRTTDVKSLEDEGDDDDEDDGDDDDEDEHDDEERFLGFGRLRSEWRLRNMRKSGLKEIKKAEKAAAKQEKEINRLLKKYTPVTLQHKLGLDKMAIPETSKNWGFYQAFVKKYDEAKDLQRKARGN
ncbi:hypothetical protein PHYBOEH_006625 [Phytophthora boehmeriae]|uniref:RxLR effector protein n=1 Tax=Phytophthora boehmeriae TaxID=109152 RepID=A0A8T1WC60_9STRA|nr:hypothetical protein PHYBOEH_006625 [Phytophthora boehmeriae]